MTKIQNSKQLVFNLIWDLGTCREPLGRTIVIWNLPFDYAQGGESFDFAQDREPVEWHVEPFGIWCL